MVEGQTYTFEVFGLRQGVMIMTDRQTGSVWTHLDGEATNGPLTGAKMEIIPILLTVWEDWVTLHPDTLVLSDDTPFRSLYQDVLAGLSDPQADQYLLYGDERLEPEELVLGVMTGGSYAAYPLFVLTETDGVVNSSVGERPIVVFYDAKNNSAIAFSRLVDGREAQFKVVSNEPFRARDSVTGSTWDITGRGVSGSGEGTNLNFATSYLSAWYGWSGYHPSTVIYQLPQ
ncbi:MAG: DUF3179 domain-containing protein [Chloroflexi bacterium]|nr:DUF3179 domain-containing protein [Chloroflexota bacterium]